MVWKAVPGFLDYEVSEHGDLRRGVKHLKPERVQGSGRKRFTLSKGGRSYRIRASHLVALAFIGPAPFDGAEVCHNDGFFHNNHFSNLRWDTRTGNVADVAKHKLQRLENSGVQMSQRERLKLQAGDLLRS